MGYLLLLFFVAIGIAFIFRSMTQEFHSWPNIKDRWFRVGVDNHMLYSHVSGTSRGAEQVQLDGEHSGCVVMMATIKARTPHAIVEVRYPERLAECLKTYPETIYQYLTRVVNEKAIEVDDEEDEGIMVVVDYGGRALQKRLHPELVEQLNILREDFRRSNSSFEFTADKLRYQQTRLLADPMPLFPVLDEMVVTINLLQDSCDHLLVQ